MKQVRFWQAETKKVARMLHAAMLAELPIGSVVQYEHGSHTINATVIEYTPYHMSDPRIKVRGMSGREYWLNLSRIVRRIE